MKHEEAAELLGAYALDAVSREEASAVERHVAGCGRCAAELAAHHEVAGMLGNAGGDAPTQVWERVAAEIARADPPAADAAAPAPVALRILVPRRRVLRAAAAGLAAAAAVALVVLGVQVHRLDGQVHQAEGAAQQLALARQVQAALVDPQAHVVSLAAPARGTPQVAALVFLPSGTAYLVNAHLPPLGPHQTYQLWQQVGTQLVSLGLLGQDPAEVPLRVDPSAADAGFAVTAEPAGGVVRPTHAPVAASSSFS